FVDGDPVAREFRLPASAGRHRLRVVAPGFRPHDGVFTATRDRSLSLRMHRDDSGRGGPADAAGADDARATQLQPNPFLGPWR
ncbi:MAG: hypothetical protein JXB32_24735, partial [Deltaproteobacteria bacterium]|nr:hypothetical protein [Deltaproteobacteria bacterium]